MISRGAFIASHHCYISSHHFISLSVCGVLQGGLVNSVINFNKGGIIEGGGGSVGISALDDH